MEILVKCIENTLKYIAFDFIVAVVCTLNKFFEQKLLDLYLWLQHWIFPPSVEDLTNSTMLCPALLDEEELEPNQTREKMMNYLAFVSFLFLVI
jgi:hypothetical protein